jgi:hypothetical protein
MADDSALRVELMSGPLGILPVCSLRVQWSLSSKHNGFGVTGVYEWNFQGAGVPGEVFLHLSLCVHLSSWSKRGGRVDSMLARFHA